MRSGHILPAFAMTNHYVIWDFGTSIPFPYSVSAAVIPCSILTGVVTRIDCIPHYEFETKEITLYQKHIGAVIYNYTYISAIMLWLCRINGSSSNKKNVFSIASAIRMWTTKRLPNIFMFPKTNSMPEESIDKAYTVYPKKYAHGFVVLCFVVVMQSFIMNSHEVFINIHQVCFAGTGAIVRLPQCQWSKPDGYGIISQCITTTKHSKAKTVCIFLGIYCMCNPVEGNKGKMTNAITESIVSHVEAINKGHRPCCVIDFCVFNEAMELGQVEMDDAWNVVLSSNSVEIFLQK